MVVTIYYLACEISGKFLRREEKGVIIGYDSNTEVRAIASKSPMRTMAN